MTLIPMSKPRKVLKMLKNGKYANMPKRYHLMQKITNNVEVSNFKCMAWLTIGICIKL